MKSVMVGVNGCPNGGQVGDRFATANIAAGAISLASKRRCHSLFTNKLLLGRFVLEKGTRKRETDTNKKERESSCFENTQIYSN